MEELQNNENRKKGWPTEVIFKNLPFLIYCAFLGILYIANAHHAEKNLREIQILKKELNEAKWEFRKIKHETMYRSTQSELAKKVEPIDLKVAKEMPKKIVTSKS